MEFPKIFTEFGIKGQVRKDGIGFVALPDIETAYDLRAFRGVDKRHIWMTRERVSGKQVFTRMITLPGLLSILPRAVSKSGAGLHEVRKLEATIKEWLAHVPPAVHAEVKPTPSGSAKRLMEEFSPMAEEVERLKAENAELKEKLAQIQRLAA